MSQTIFIVLFFTIIYAVDICDSKCSEYILVIKEKKCLGRYFMQPAMLSEINWNTDCPDNSTTLSYDAIFTNKSCVIELSYMSSRTECPNIIKPYIASTHEFIPSNVSISKPIVSPREENITTTPSVCKVDDDIDTCNKKISNTTVKVINDKTVDTISLIFINGTTTKNNLELVQNNRQDLNFVMLCTYKDNTCSNLNDNDIVIDNIADAIDLNNQSVTENTIFVSVDNNDDTKTKTKLNVYKNVTDFNCTGPLDRTQVIPDKYVILTYNVIRKYSCGGGYTNNIGNRTNNTIITHEVNVYFHIDFTHNISTENIKCTDRFESVNNHIQNLDCTIAALNYNNNNKSDLTYEQLFGTDLIKSPIWHCVFRNPTYNDNVNDPKIIDFGNCMEHSGNLNSSNHLNNNSVILILKKENIAFNKTTTHNDKSTKPEDSGKLIYKDNLNLHLEFGNISKWNKTKQLNITTGRIINAWTDDDEQIVRRLYNTTLLELNVINDMNNNSKDIQGENHINKSLDFNIIFNKQNNTDLKAYIIEDLNKIKTNATKVIILDCVLPEYEVTENISDPNKYNKLVIECGLTDLDAFNKTSKEATQKANKIKVVQSSTEKPKDKFEKIQVIKDKQQPTETVPTESDRQSHQSGFASDGYTSLDPIVYILIGLGTICAVSLIVIVALRKWKRPISYHVTSTRDWPVIDDS